MKPPLDLEAAWAEHKARVLADRDAPDELHASDLAACPTAVWQRINGVPQLPNDDGSFANFERGFAFEERVLIALAEFTGKRGLMLTHGAKVAHDGIIGNLDFVVLDGDGPMAVIDATGTAAKTTEWKYSHALKTAFYAYAIGAPHFAEFVIRFGFGGTIVAVEQHWFALDDDYRGLTWRERVEHAVASLKNLAIAGAPPAEPMPPWNPRDEKYDTWLCEKYCRATQCVKNQRLSKADRDALRPEDADDLLAAFEAAP